LANQLTAVFGSQAVGQQLVVEAGCVQPY
jgi:hypothetical protein